MTAPPATILVVGASEPGREDVMRRLSAQGYGVAAAADCDGAFALVAQERPDAILLAGHGSAAALGRLRADEELAAVPVIVLAEDADPDVLRRGAQDFLVAPFDPAELDARVMAALRVKALHDQLVEANRRLAEQAMTDELTGLANRRHGAHALERAVALAVRHGHALALARIDLDRFKAINDTHGHQAGDEVLAEVAHRLAEAVRGGDELARWGGDEFVAILPATDRAGALRAAERMRAAVAVTPVEVRGAQVPVTISVGWAHWVGDTPDDLLARADRALYEAKDVGRDTVRPGPLTRAAG
jgi:two-component system cell cycle response regulator